MKNELRETLLRAESLFNKIVERQKEIQQLLAEPKTEPKK